MVDRWRNIVDEILSDNVKVVSFDIFDTLLVRPVVSPTDLFRLVPGNDCISPSEFTELRIQSEKLARRDIKYPKEDVTLDEIYTKLFTLTGLESKSISYLKERELQVEEKYLYARKTLQQLYNDVLNSGKEVVITSDMYLPRPFIEKVLEENGYKGYSKLYLSCVEGCTKGSGKLFAKIIEEYSKKGISAGEIVHIGDNQNADVKKPKSLGIRTFFAPSAISVFSSKVAFGKIIKELHRSFDDRFLIGYLANSLFDNPYAPHPLDSIFNGKVENIGKIVAPLMLSFSKWLLDESNRDRLDLLLLAYRDGYLPEKIIKILESCYSTIPKIKRIYLSRNVRYSSYSLEGGLIKGLIELPPSNEMSVRDFINNRLLVDDAEELNNVFLLFLSCGYKSLDDPIGKLENYVRILPMLNNVFIKNGKIRADQVRAYCESLVSGYDNIGVFDIGYRGSVANFLQDIVHKDIICYHLMETPLGENSKCNIKSFVRYGFNTVNQTGILHAFMEDLVSIQEPTAKQIIRVDSGFIVLREGQIEFNHTLDVIQRSIIEYSENIVKLFGKDLCDMKFDHYLIFELIVDYLTNPVERDAKLLADMHFVESSFIGTRDVYQNWRSTRCKNNLEETIEPEPTDPVLMRLLKRFHLYNISKKLYPSIQKAFLEEGSRKAAQHDALYNQIDFEIKSSINQMAELAKYIKNPTIFFGDVISYDKGICNYLNTISENVSLVMVSEAPWVDSNRTRNRFRFPSFVVPAFFGKNRYLSGSEFKINKPIKELISSKSYLKNAALNWKMRSPGMSESYSLVLSGLSYKYICDIIDTFNPAKVALWNAFHPFHLIIRGICAEKSIPMVYMEFGSLPGTFDISEYGQMGESYAATHIEEFKAIPVSDADYKRTEAICTSLYKSRLNRNTQQNKSILNILPQINPESPTIFYAGQNDFESGISPYTEKSKEFHSPIFTSSDKAAKYLSRLAKKNGWNFIYKPHPIMEMMGLTNHIPDCIDGSGIDVNDLVDYSDVTVTILSQVSYISLIRGKPTLMLGYTQLRGKECTYEAFEKDIIEQKIIDALKNGFTEEMKSMFVKHVTQMLNTVLFDDGTSKSEVYGLTPDLAHSHFK